MFCLSLFNSPKKNPIPNKLGIESPTIAQNVVSDMEFKKGSFFTHFLFRVSIEVFRNFIASSCLYLNACFICSLLNPFDIILKLKFLDTLYSSEFSPKNPL